MNKNNNGSLPRILEEAATGALFLFGGSALATFLSAICGILIARLLGPELYGVYSLAFIPPFFLAVFTCFGVNFALTRYVAYYGDRGERSRIVSLIKTGLFFIVLESLLVIALAYLLLREVTVLLTNRQELVELVRSILIMIVFQAIIATTSSILLGFGDTKKCALIGVIEQTIRLTFAPLLVILGFSVLGALVGNVLAYIVGAVSGTLFVYNYYKKLYTSSSSTKYSIIEDLRLMLSYGTPLYIASITVTLTDTFRGVILAYSTSDFVIGNFNVALRFTTLITILLAPISSVLFPAFSKLSDNKEDLEKMFRYAVKFSSLLIIPASIFALTMSRELVYVLFGSGYTLAPWYLSLIALNYLYIGVGSVVLTSFFNGVGNPTINFKATLIYAGVFISSSTLLTRAIGVEGLIASIILATGISTIYSLKVAKVKYRVKPDYKSSLAILIASAISIVPIILVIMYFHEQSFFINLFKLLVGSIIYLFVYLTLIPAFKAINVNDVKILAEIFIKIKPLKPLVEVLVRYEQNIMKIFNIQ